MEPETDMELKVELMFEAFDELTDTELASLAYPLGAGKLLELTHERMFDNLHDMTLAGTFDRVTTIEEAVAALRDMIKQ